MPRSKTRKALDAANKILEGVRAGHAQGLTPSVEEAIALLAASAQAREPQHGSQPPQARRVSASQARAQARAHAQLHALAHAPHGPPGPPGAPPPAPPNKKARKLQARRDVQKEREQGAQVGGTRAAHAAPLQLGGESPLARPGDADELAGAAAPPQPSAPGCARAPPAAPADGALAADDAADAATPPPTASELAELAAFGAPFALDPFQLRAVRALLAGCSVLVCAPTSAGKSLVGEFALWRALRAGGRAIYTSPIRALSNQKYRELHARFGGDVGLVTGEVCLSPAASLLVVTAEVLRFGLLGQDASMLHKLRAVVLDEAHYVSDRARGFVWEETIALLPPGVQLALLSATVADAPLLAGWVTAVRGGGGAQPAGGEAGAGGDGADGARCVVVRASRRPVPLRHYVAPLGSPGLFLVRDGEGPVRWARLQSAVALAAAEAGARGEAARRRGGAGGAAAARAARLEGALEVAEGLRGEGLLPAILFFGSRREAEEAAEAVLRWYGRGEGEGEEEGEEEGGGEDEAEGEADGGGPGRKRARGSPAPAQDGAGARAARRGGRARLVSGAQAAAIGRVFDAAAAQLSDEDAALPQLAQARAQLCAGVGAHHGGALPLVREVCELLFAEGLLPLLCATETLAVGVNLPARSVVLTAPSKWDGGCVRLLRGGEYAQMAGRAGRRGADAAGVAVLMLDGAPGSDGAGPPDAAALRGLLELREPPLAPSAEAQWPLLLGALRADQPAAGARATAGADGGAASLLGAFGCCSLGAWVAAARLREASAHEASLLALLERGSEGARGAPAEPADDGAGAPARAAGAGRAAPPDGGAGAAEAARWDEVFRTRRMLWALQLRLEATVRAHAGPFLQPGRLVCVRAHGAPRGEAADALDGPPGARGAGRETWGVLVRAGRAVAAAALSAGAGAEEAAAEGVLQAAAAAAAGAGGAAEPAAGAGEAGRAGEAGSAGGDGSAGGLGALYLDVALPGAEEGDEDEGGRGGKARPRRAEAAAGTAGGAPPAAPPVRLCRVRWSELVALSPARLWLPPDLAQRGSRLVLGASLAAACSLFGGSAPRLDLLAQMGAHLDAPARDGSGAGGGAPLSLRALLGRIEALERALLAAPPFAAPPRARQEATAGPDAAAEAAAAFEAARLRSRLALARRRVAQVEHASGGGGGGGAPCGAEAAMLRALRSLGLAQPHATSGGGGGGGDGPGLRLSVKGRAASVFNCSDGLLCAQLLLGGAFCAPAPGGQAAAAGVISSGPLLAAPEACALLACLAQLDGPRPPPPAPSAAAAESAAKASARRAAAAREGGAELPADLRRLHGAALAGAAEVLDACEAAGVRCDADAYVGGLSPKLMAAAHAWAAGGSFGAAAALTDELPGVLLRGLRSVAELAREFGRAAAELGDGGLCALFEACAEGVARGLVCAPSLYVPGEPEPGGGVAPTGTATC